MSRFPRSPRPYEFNRGPAINDRIRARQVLLIDENNEKVGVVETIEALRRAHAAGLDLVEVASDAAPPVCRILDFGKYKYELAKKEKASKAKAKTTEMKEVRLGRSMKIDPHDVSIRVNQAHGFLMEGHKVLIVQNFRGRELQHKHLGDARMKEIIEKLSDVSRVEVLPRLNGRRMAMILAPDKPKIDALKRRTGKGSGGTPVDSDAAHADESAVSGEPTKEVASVASDDGRTTKARQPKPAARATSEAAASKA